MADTHRGLGTQLLKLVDLGDGTYAEAVALVAGASTPAAGVEGKVADGAALTGVKPVLMGGQDGTNVQSLLVDTSGRPMVVGAAAHAAAVAGNPVLVGASDGTSARELRMAGTSGTTSQNLRVALFNGAAEASVATQADTLTNSSPGLVTAGLNYLLNAAATPSWDRWRNNSESLVVTRTAQTTSYTGSDRTNYNGRGIIGFLNVTVNPGGAETLTFILQAKDNMGGSAYYTVATSGAIAVFGAGAGATGLEVICAYPGAAETAALTGFTTTALPLPRTYRWLVTHSAAGAWTYTVADNVAM